MPTISYPSNLITALSDFWLRFFADYDQLEAMYEGSAIKMGEAYVDVLSNVLGLSIQDAPLFNREYFKLVLLNESDRRYAAGITPTEVSWSYPLPDGIVDFAALNNKILEPDVSLEKGRGIRDISNGRVYLDASFDDYAANSLFAERATDIDVGGLLTDVEWPENFSPQPGDTIRLLSLGAGDGNLQTKRSDHTIVLIRPGKLYVSAETPFQSGLSTVTYTLLQVPYATNIVYEALIFFGDTADLLHTRLDAGSVQVFAKRQSDGADVVEGVDYRIDYERGRLIRITPWTLASILKVNYSWRVETFPVSGPVPRYSMTGKVTYPTKARARQRAVWVHDALIDRRVLAANFGYFIGHEEASTEAYRAFLRGIFQLYMLGPVLERIESAMNVVLGFPVPQTDNEVLSGYEIGATLKRVFTRRADGKQTIYEFPLGAPIRSDLTSSMNVGVLTLRAFEPMTTAITVSDWIKDPTWWHNIVIPSDLLKGTQGTPIDTPRRTVVADYVPNIIGAHDGPRIGDPGLIIGTDEEGRLPAVQPALRRRFAFVVMDRYLKHHMFTVRFDPAVLNLASPGARFARSIDDLNDLIFSAKPAHTYVVAQPSTTFVDSVVVAENGVYQPQRYLNANPEAQEVYASVHELPSDTAPYVVLGLLFTPKLDIRARVLFADKSLRIGVNDWRIGDYSHYRTSTEVVDFATEDPQTLGNVPTPPVRARLVHVFVDGLIDGKRLVENVDYEVDYTAREITRISTWDVLVDVEVTYLDVIVGNVADTPANAALGDRPIQLDEIDPALSRADYDGELLDSFGDPYPIEDHRDLSLVEHSLTIEVT